MGVPDVSPPPETTPPPAAQNAQVVSSGAVPASVSTVGQLPKPLANAIMMSIAMNICDASKQSTQRIHDVLADAEAQSG